MQTVPAEVAERIELTQPFNRPADEVARDGLLCLASLDNDDKHRSNIEVNIACDQINMSMTVEWVNPGAAARNVPPHFVCHTPELADGALLMELQSNDPIKSVGGGVGASFMFTVETPTGRQQLFTVLAGLI